MKAKSLYLILLMLSLSCNFVTERLLTSPPTGTPSATLTPSETPFPAPAYIPPSCSNQPLATLPASTTIAQTDHLDANPSLTRDQQLGVFEELTHTIDEVYVYPDFNGLDWHGVVAKYRAKVEGGLETEAFYVEMQNMVFELDDEHSYFESPVQAANSKETYAGENKYVGIGVYVSTLLEKNRLLTLSIFPDSPAEHAGIKAHDTLLAVDGLPLVENGKAFSERLLGPPCSVIRLTMQSPAEEPRDIVLMRHEISSSFMIDARFASTSDGSRVGYIYIPTFFEKTITGQVKKALEDFGDLDGLILDNRMNGGGSSSVTEPILSFFVSGKLGDFVSRQERRPLNVTADPIHNSQTVPLVVLVGEDTASFGEIFSGILNDVNRAKIVGQLTLGNVETLHGYSFPDGSQAWIAEETFDPVNSHENWEKDGIRPDVEAFADWDTFTFENDPGVIAAVKLLGH